MYSDLYENDLYLVSTCVGPDSVDHDFGHFVDIRICRNPQDLSYGVCACGRVYTCKSAFLQCLLEACRVLLL